MASVNLKSLVAKLNDPCRRALEAAAGLCLSRTHYNVEIEHWLLKLLDVPGGDLSIILRQYDVDASRLVSELTRVLDRLKTGNARPPALSPNVVDLAREAWLLASLEYGAPRTTSGHILLALLTDDSLARVARDASPQFEKIAPEALKRDLPTLLQKSSETSAGDGAGGQASGRAGGPARSGSTEALEQYTIDLTERAKQGKIDPVLGRDSEIRQLVDILSRRRQNNPILTGEAGVGKTAVVEGFARRVAEGDVPPSLQNVAIRTLDLGLLQAGAGVKGEFENRLKSVIEGVKASPQPIILFIDEAHTLIGAGGSAGQGDAANLLKPALARGELRTVAATTWAEYKKYFEKDAALARRFQVVKVEEPSEEAGIEMMRGLARVMQSHHKVRILDEAIIDSVKLSHRYISGRQLPDKSVSLLDTACAKVGISHSTIPAAIEDCRRRIDQLGVAMEALRREEATGADHSERIAELTKSREGSETELARLEEKWKQEKALVEKIRELQGQLENGSGAAAASSPAGAKSDGRAGGATDAADGGVTGSAAGGTSDAPAATVVADRKVLLQELQDVSEKLKSVQSDTPLMHVCVDSQAVAEVVASWTGIPVGRMVADEISTVLTLKEKMEEKIVGQSHALEEIAQRVRTARAGLTDPRKPIGVFLLVGPSGVGKTETAITLAELLYGGDQNMTVINMSEFKEEHKVSLLMGSPPGYVGYGEGGVLTEAVRRRPYSVVLLDEMEKAHPGIQDIFYQVFDKGMMQDGEGREIDFKNTLILMTSNAATDTVVSLCADPETMPDAAGLADAIRPELLKTFKPAFLGRVSVVPYFPLSDDVMKKIVRLQLGRVARRVKDAYRASFEYTPAVVDGIASRCHEVHTGARNVDHILSRTLLPELSAECLARMAAGEGMRSVKIDMDENGGFRYQLS